MGQAEFLGAKIHGSWVMGLPRAGAQNDLPPFATPHPWVTGMGWQGGPYVMGGVRRVIKIILKRKVGHIFIVAYNGTYPPLCKHADLVLV